MAGKRDKPEEIVAKLRQVDVLQGQGQSIAGAVRQIGVTQQTYYRWRKQYGGMGRDQLLRLKELEKKNLGLLGQSQIWRLINSYFRLRRNRGRRPRKSGEEAVMAE